MTENQTDNKGRSAKDVTGTEDRAGRDTGSGPRPGRGLSQPRDRSTTVSALSTEQGSTTIADGVVSKIAGIAAREVLGVYAVGGGAARAFGALRERIPGGSTNFNQGVTVEVGQEEAAVDLEIVAEYGVAISDVAEAVRRNIITSIERMTGLRVIEVNIDVSDIHLPEEDDEPSTDDSRVL